MEYKKTYVCDTCGYVSKNYDDMKKHEALHLGLTVEEMDTYKALRSFAEYMKAVSEKINSEETRIGANRAIERVIAFEKEYGISA